MSKRMVNPEPGRVAAERIASDCLAVRVRLLSRIVTAIYDDALRPLGLRVSQMNILVVVAKRGRTSPGEVGATLHMEKSTLSRNVERMRQNGWLEVLPGRNDRTHVLSMTRKGEKLLEKSLPLWEQAQHEAGTILGEQGAQAVRRTAERLWSAGVNR